METLDPKIAKDLEEKAVKEYLVKDAPKAKTKPLKENYYHSRVLGKFRSVFPFEFFPDELIISERRVIWIHRYGFWMNRVVSVLHQDIADIEASSGPFFGHLHIRNFTGGEEIVMEHLWKKDLQKARDLTELLMMKHRVGIKDRSIKDSVKDQLEKMMHVDF